MMVINGKRRIKWYLKREIYLLYECIGSLHVSRICSFKKTISIYVKYVKCNTETNNEK